MDRVHRKLLALVALLAVGSAVGVVLLWPAARPAPQAPPAPLVDAVVRSATEIDCPEEDFVPIRPPCLLAEVEIVEGPDAGLRFDVDTGQTGAPPFNVGDRVKVYGSPDPDGVFYSVADYDRLSTMGWLVGLFVVTVLAAGRWHGLRSLVGLGISLLIITIFVVPAILAGSNPLAVAIVGAFTIMLVTLYLSHGLNVKTTTALVGTAGALVLTGVLGIVFAQISKLTGLSSEDAQLLANSVQGISLSGLVLTGLIISALGVLDDVTVTQASAVFAVHEADPAQSWATLFRRAMNVGRDHIASTVNTLVLAYAGASITLLLLFSTSGQSVAEILNSEIVAAEVVKTLVGSIGLIVAVPLTTALAATLAVRQGSSATPAPLDDRDPQGRGPVQHEHERWVRSLRGGAIERTDT